MDEPTEGMHRAQVSGARWKVQTRKAAWLLFDRQFSLVYELNVVLCEKKNFLHDLLIAERLLYSRNSLIHLDSPCGHFISGVCQPGEGWAP